MLNRFRSVSLKLLLSISFSTVALVTTVLLGGTILILTKGYFRQELNNKLKNLSSTAALMINADDHKKLLSAEDENSEGYKKIRAILQKIKSQNPDVRFIYTMRKMDKKIKFIVDAEIDPESMSHLGDVYEEESVGLKSAFENPGQVAIEPDFFADKWGIWLSAFAPIITSDGVFDGVVGVDMAATTIMQQESELRSLVIVCSLLTCIVALGLGIFLARKVSSSLDLLAQEILKVQAFDLTDAQTVSDSSIAEIKAMTHAVDSMKKGLRSFKKYVPADLVVELLKVRKEAQLGTEKKTITLMFSDIADFTSISEKITPDELSRNLGDYLQGVSEVIKKNNGTIDKFIGDAVMAFWGAPNELPNHALAACHAVLECMNTVNAINLDLARRGYPPFKTRFGIHTGDAIVGNMGHSERLSYTAIGDSVNLASRIESINKRYGTEVLISEGTWSLVSDHFVARVIDQVVVKGKTVPLKIYQLMGLKNNITKESQERIHLFNSYMEHYFSGNLNAALSGLKEMQKENPLDLPLQILVSKLEEAKKENSDYRYHPTEMKEK